MNQRELRTLRVVGMTAMLPVETLLFVRLFGCDLVFVVVVTALFYALGEWLQDPLLRTIGIRLAIAIMAVMLVITFLMGVRGNRL